MLAFTTFESRVLRRFRAFGKMGGLLLRLSEGDVGDRRYITMTEKQASKQASDQIRKESQEMRDDSSSLVACLLACLLEWSQDRQVLFHTSEIFCKLLYQSSRNNTKVFFTTVCSSVPTHLKSLI